MIRSAKCVAIPPGPQLALLLKGCEGFLGSLLQLFATPAVSLPICPRSGPDPPNGVQPCNISICRWVVIPNYLQITDALVIATVVNYSTFASLTFLAYDYRQSIFHVEKHLADAWQVLTFETEVLDISYTAA